MNKKCALVTGGAGFLGRHLCKRLLDEGYKVVALDNLYTGSRENIAEFASNPDFTFVEGDVCDAELFGLVGRDDPIAPHGRALVPPSASAGDGTSALPSINFTEIYNLACPASPVHYQARPIFTTKTSIFGILNCLELAKKCGAKLLHTSTSEVYGDALVHPQVESYWGNVNTIGIRSCYDEGKRVAETLAADYIRQYDDDVRMVRIFNTYGPYMHPQDGRVVSNFIMQALRGENLTIYGDGSQTRSFQYCDDLINAFRLYMGKTKEEIREFFNGRVENSRVEVEKGRESYHPPVPVLNTGNPGEFTMLELAEEVLKQTGSSCKLEFHPLPGDDPKQRKPDITLAKEFLGWEPKIPLAEGLAKTIEYFRGK